MKVNFLINPLIPGEVKHSLFAKKVTFLGTTSGIKIESLKDKWLEAMITGPVVGTWRRPVTLGLKSNINNGAKKDLRMR